MRYIIRIPEWYGRGPLYVVPCQHGEWNFGEDRGAAMTFGSYQKAFKYWEMMVAQCKANGRSDSVEAVQKSSIEPVGISDDHTEHNCGTRVVTASGKWLDFLAPTLDMVTLSDVVWGMSGVYRFAGQGNTEPRMTVLQHCLNVACDVASQPGGATITAIKLALIHDGHEAYHGDLTTPLKQALTALGAGEAYRTLKRRLQTVVEEKLLGPGFVSRTTLDQVKAADAKMLREEGATFLPTVPGCAWEHTAPRMLWYIPKPAKVRAVFYRAWADPQWLVGKKPWTLFDEGGL